MRAAAHAWTVTAAPMLFGTLVTVAGFLPIGFARSGVGEYAGNIFWVLAASLLASWLVAVTFTPYLGVKLLRRAPAGGRHSHDAIYHTVGYRRLRALIVGCVRWRKTVVAGTVALLLLAAVGMVTLVQKQFFPGSDRPEVLVSVHLPQGSGIAATEAVVRRIEAVLAPMAELERRIDELPREREIVAYCRGPFCLLSDEAVRLLLLSLAVTPLRHVWHWPDLIFVEFISALVFTVGLTAFLVEYLASL